MAELKSLQPFINLATELCSVFYIVFVCALAFWIWRDARRRGAMPLFWAIAVLPFNDRHARAKGTPQTKPPGTQRYPAPPAPRSC